MILKNAQIVNDDFILIKADIAKMVSKNPAESLGIYDETGSISVGKYADLVVLDKDFNLVETYVNGEKSINKF